VALDKFLRISDFFFAHSIPRVIPPDDFECWGDGYLVFAYPIVCCLADLVHVIFSPGACFVARSLVTLDQESGHGHHQLERKGKREDLRKTEVVQQGGGKWVVLADPKEGED